MNNASEVVKLNEPLISKKTLRDYDFDSKRVLVRVDFNVPLDENRQITDDKRIVAALPTIKYLLEHHAKVILCSHLGRPKGKIVPEMSLKPVYEKLCEILPGVTIKFAHDAVGEDAKAKVNSLNNGEILLLENLRFYPEEEKNSPEFAKELASLADIFVSDAFGTVHRAHASTAGVCEYLPSAVGFLIEKEINALDSALNNPKRPFVAILGGLKVKDKIGVIRNLLSLCDTLLIGGGMGYFFLRAQGYEIGESVKTDEESIALAKELLQEAKEKQVDLVLPIDIVVGEEFSNETKYYTVNATKIPKGMIGMDIGENTIELFSKYIKSAKTVVWNGPVGVFEFSSFAKGTGEIAKACAESGAVTIIGGGDSAAAVIQMGYEDKMTHISTGGGASLEYLEGKKLPGIEAIQDK